MSTDGQEPAPDRIKFNAGANSAVIDLCPLPRVLACNRQDYEAFLSGDAEFPDLKDMIATLTYLLKGEDGFRRLVTRIDEHESHSDEETDSDKESDWNEEFLLCGLEAHNSDQNEYRYLAVYKKDSVVGLMINFCEYAIDLEDFDRHSDLKIVFKIQNDNTWKPYLYFLINVMEETECSDRSDGWKLVEDIAVRILADKIRSRLPRTSSGR